MKRLGVVAGKPDETVRNQGFAVVIHGIQYGYAYALAVWWYNLTMKNPFTGQPKKAKARRASREFRGFVKSFHFDVLRPASKRWVFDLIMRHRPTLK